MDDNQFLIKPFFSPQTIKDYKLPTSELKTHENPFPDLRNQKDDHKIQTEQSHQGSPEIMKSKLIKRNKRTDLGNYPQLNNQRKQFFPKLDNHLSNKQSGKIKSNNLNREQKKVEKQLGYKWSVTEEGETLQKYLQNKKYREKIQLYSQSAGRKVSTQSAISKFKRGSVSQQLKRGDISFSEDQKQKSSIRFVSLKTQLLGFRRTFLQIFYESKKQNKIMGRFQLRIPKIPQKSGLSAFISKYRPNNEEINLNNLLKANFCAVQYSQNELYIGQMIGKHKQGLGILITPNSCFEGEWKNNQKVKGIQITRTGVYHGTYFDSKRSGQGEFHRHSGDIYVGDWREGKKHGVGLWINSKGESYNGDWQYGKPEGSGTLTVTGRTYKGNFSDSKQSGFGRERFSNGDVFEGFFKQNFPNGKGIYTWRNGGVFEGNFVNGMREGFGQLRIQGEMTFRGHYIRDKPEGQCQILLRNRQIWSGVTKNKHESNHLKNIYPDRIWKERLDL